MTAPYHIEPVPHEVGRYMVTSKSLFCQDTLHCRFSVSNRSSKGVCPQCGLPLDTIDYLVDLLMNEGLGRCACDHWRYKIQPMVAKLTVAERRQGRRQPELVCQHIAAARVFFCLEYIDRINQAPFERWGIGEANGE